MILLKIYCIYSCLFLLALVNMAGTDTNHIVLLPIYKAVSNIMYSLGATPLKSLHTRNIIPDYCLLACSECKHDFRCWLYATWTTGIPSCSNTQMSCDTQMSYDTQMSCDSSSRLFRLLGILAVGYSVVVTFLPTTKLIFLIKRKMKNWGGRYLYCKTCTLSIYERGENLSTTPKCS